MPKVWYTGVGSRTITSADWLERGITASDASWNTSNAWAVDHNALNAAQLNVLAGDKDFLLNQEGPRAWPRPVSPVEEHQSGYVYYARLLQIYDAMIELGGGVLTQLPPYVRFSSAIAMLGVTATDRAYQIRTLSGARMRVSSAPQGSALTAKIQSFDGFSWEDIGTVSISDGSVIEATTSFTKVQGVGNLLRAEITSVGSTSAATGVAIDVLVSAADTAGGGSGAGEAAYYDGTAVTNSTQLHVLNVLPSKESTTSSAGTLTLTSGSAQVQEIIGTTTHTVVLPSTGVDTGMEWKISNKSTGAVTVQASDLSAVATIAAGDMGAFTNKVDTPSLSTQWLVLANG